MMPGENIRLRPRHFNLSSEDTIMLPTACRWTLILVSAMTFCAGPAHGGETAGEPPSRWHFDLDLYGYVKLDTAYESSRTSPGEFAKWVLPDPATGEDGAYHATLNQTRLGLRLEPAGKARFLASGRVEIDFYGKVQDPDPRIRHAYVTLAWPDAGFDIIVGQTSDVISPLNPQTLNYTVAWWAGNIGFRRPQIRISKYLATGGESELLLEGALTHNIYDTRVGSLVGEDAGLAAQARLSFTFPGIGTQPTTIGISGHRAEEDFTTGDVTTRSDSWSGDLDLTLPLTGTVRLQCELFTGAGLGPYLGGVGQGVDPIDFHGIKSRGGWLALNVVTPSRHRLRGFNAGVSVDDVDGADLAPGGRELNRSIFANVLCALREKIELGVEISRWTTRYKERDTRDALRTQVSLIYKI